MLRKPAKRGPKARTRIRRTAPLAARKSRPAPRRRTPRASLQRRAEEACRRYVMRRDPDCQAMVKCQGTTRDSTWAHGFGRGAYPNVVCDPVNSWRWCLPCHEYLDSHAAAKKRWMKAYLGAERYEALRELALRGPKPDYAAVIAALEAEA